MTRTDSSIKRLFDLTVALIGLFVLWPVGVVIAVAILVTSKGPVLYRQKRVGRRGELFNCVKFRTMITGADTGGSITTGKDCRITPLGKLLRRYKLDEFPQLVNVVLGKMSFVGPRPDVPGYADRLQGDDRRILELRPGITGPASILFRHEEEILSFVDDPVLFNDTVLWPEKVRLNRTYLDNWSFWKDIGYILVTLFPYLDRVFRLVGTAPKKPGW